MDRLWTEEIEQIIEEVKEECLIKDTGPDGFDTREHIRSMIGFSFNHGVILMAERLQFALAKADFERMTANDTRGEDQLLGELLQRGK